MGNIKRFEDLIAWQQGMTVARLIYRSTTDFPKTEMYGLTSQMRRAAVSIPSNIAEGFGRESRSDLLRFLRVARGSLFELRTQMRLSIDLNYMTIQSAPMDEVNECDRVLQALIRSLENKNKKVQSQ